MSAIFWDAKCSKAVVLDSIQVVSFKKQIKVQQSTVIE